MTLHYVVQYVCQWRYTMYDVTLVTLYVWCYTTLYVWRYTMLYLWRYIMLYVNNVTLRCMYDITLRCMYDAALENEVGIQQCRPKCRPINLPGWQIFANLNSAKVRIFFGADSC